MSIRVRLFAMLLTIVSGHAYADPLTIRIGTPDQSVGGTPSGGIAISTLLDGRKLLDEEFAKDGIKVEWTYFKGAGPAVNEALASKQLDFAILGDLAAIIGRANGLNTHFIVPARGANSYLAVAADSGITKLEDLKGKRVTVFKGTAYQLSFDRALARVGLTERDLQVVNLDWNAAISAIAAKQLDANWSGLQAVVLRDKGLAKLVLSTRELGREYSFHGGFVVTDEFATAHPDLTQRLVNVVVKTQHYLSRSENLETFIQETSQRSGIPASLGRTELEGDDLKFRFSPRADDFIVDAFQSSIEQAKQLGLIRKTYDARSWIEPKFVDRAIQDLKLEGFWPLYDSKGQPKS